MGYRRIDVRDRKNPERVLGVYHCAPEEWRGRFLEAAIWPRFPSAAYRPSDRIDFSLEMRRVTFQLGHVPSKDGYDMIGVLLTDAPLKDLMELRDFELGATCIRDETKRERWERFHAEQSRRMYRGEYPLDPRDFGL